MKEYTYLIIGGGMAADAAVKGIREIDSIGTIGILTKESDPPYRRPPLSKDLWTNKSAVDKIFCQTEKHRVDIMLNRTVERIDPLNHTVTDQVETIRYGRLLLATGGSPRRLPFEDENIRYFHTLEDYGRLRHEQEERQHYGVIGGGFIGCEISAALISMGRKVTMVFPEKDIGSGVFPPEVSSALSDLYRKNGVELMSGVKVSGLTCDEGQCNLKLESGRTVKVDGLVAGIGMEPEAQLAEDAGLEVDDGIVVDGQLQTSQEDIFAAGDVANFYNPALAQRMRVEHEDHALESGRLAGWNMTGMHDTYIHLPFFYSDLFDVGYEALGELDASMTTLGIWNGLHEKGIWAYVREGRVRGMLFWNLFGKTDDGRALIRMDQPLDERQLHERLRTILEAPTDV